MEMTGERRIPAPRQTVWEALNNPDILKASIPGCQSLEKLSDDQMKATAAVKVGPISARFTGTVHLTDIDPPNGYRINGEGQGGVAGFAKGGATVGLTDDGADTLLNYAVNAQVGGKLAQLGGRLIDATAKQMADQFFDRFSKEVVALSPASPRARAGGSRGRCTCSRRCTAVLCPGRSPPWKQPPRRPPRPRPLHQRQPSHTAVGRRPPPGPPWPSRWPSRGPPQPPRPPSRSGRCSRVSRSACRWWPGSDWPSMP